MIQHLSRNIELMFQPKFKICLKKQNFYGAEAICFGSQLVTIIQLLKQILSSHTWYAADIDAFSTISEDLNLDTSFLEKIGTDDSFIQFSDKINQFLQGIFLAIDNRFSNENIHNIELSTEDQEFRSIKLDGILIEIRAFDTSFFELYSDEEKIIKQLAHIFDVNIISSL